MVRKALLIREVDAWCIVVGENRRPLDQQVRRHPPNGLARGDALNVLSVSP